MNMNDLMEVWRSQDAAPLHGVNETLLRLALRNDEAKLQAQQRCEQRVAYGMAAFFVAVMAVMVGFMIHRRDGGMLTPWDIGIPILGAAAALFWPGFLRRSHRTQALREQKFGESLREQLERHLTRLDYHARRFASPMHHLFTNLPAIVWSVAFFFAMVRLNQKPGSEVWTDPRIWAVFGGSLVLAFVAVVVSIHRQRRWIEEELTPHKRRLETLLREIEE
jgi:hypothetical protein